MFGLHFVKTGIISEKLGEFYMDIFDMRHTGDYKGFMVLERKDVIELLQPAAELIARIEILLTEK